MSKNIAIAGMGWLGQPLAYHLERLGYSVKGSVTRAEKVAQLRAKGFQATAVLITENGTQGTPVALLAGADVLMVMIPPGLRNNTGSNYALKMAHFITEIERYNVPKVILISSTSVYDDAQGNVTEEDLPKPQRIAGKQLLEVEQLFSSNPNFICTIVRFGGLYGGSRNPIRFLAGRTGLSNGDAPVNLIHRDDCIGILTSILKQEAFGQVFNAVSPVHPTKRVYYTQRAKALDLTPPEYIEESEGQIFKQIDSLYLEKVLGYQFIHILKP